MFRTESERVVVLWCEWRVNRGRQCDGERKRRVRAGETGMRLMEWSTKS